MPFRNVASLRFHAPLRIGHLDIRKVGLFSLVRQERFDHSDRCFHGDEIIVNLKTKKLMYCFKIPIADVLRVEYVNFIVELRVFERVVSSPIFEALIFVQA